MDSKMWIHNYFKDFREVLYDIDHEGIDKMVNTLVDVRDKLGRVFFIGVGGGAANASHATNDFRKVAGMEAYCLTDNIAEVTARTNDDGWESVFVRQLGGSHFGIKDAIFIFSVSGGDGIRGMSTNIVEAVYYAKEKKAKVLGITGPNGGYTKVWADVCITIPEVDPKLITAFTESMQAVIWHLLVCHPQLQVESMRYEKVMGKE